MKAFYFLIFTICLLNPSEAVAIKTTTIQVQKTVTKSQSKKKLNRWQRFKNHFSKKKISIKKWLKRKAINKTLVGILLIFGVTMFGSTLIFLGAAFAFSLLASATTAAILAGIVAAIGGYFLTEYLYQSIVKEKSPLWLKITAGFFALIPLLAILAFYTSE